jgi:antitoxin component YwqK of YwqJK toxin-antitoxin module
LSDNKTLKYEIPYVDGKTHGILKEYDKNGSLISETPYVNGQIQGI